jgi:hypothetical protein
VRPQWLRQKKTGQPVNQRDPGSRTELWLSDRQPLIYRRTGNLRAARLLLGHPKIESTVRYLGIEVDDARTQILLKTRNSFDYVTGFMHKSASFRIVFKSPARFTAPGFVLGAATT